LRSPLASLRLCLETLERSEISSGQRESLRQMMLDDVDRLSGFIDDILEATRLEHGDRVHSVARVQLDELVRRCATAVARRHKMEPDVVTVDIPGGFEIATDSTALEIVVRNLLDNAIKYSEGTPVVTITATTADGRVIIEVVDRGIGIPRHALSRVFDRFYRVDEEAVRARRGTGLGLFVVRALVRSLGGKLRAHSDGPGTGTTMTVTLPIQTASPQPEAAPQGAHA
jgi:signal transduction histidine kinase